MKTIEEFRQEFKKYVQDKDFEKAFEVCDEWLLHHPYYEHNILHHKGNVYVQLKQHQEAEQCYQAALEIEPKYSPLLFNLGALYYANEKYEQALEYLNLALANLERDHPSGRYKIEEMRIKILRVKGYVSLYSGDLEEATNCIDEVLNFNPLHADARAYQILLLIRKLKNDPDAKEHLEEVLAYDFEETNFLCAKGEGFYVLNNYESALECYQLAIGQGIKKFVIYYHAGNASESLKRYGEAIEYYQKAHELKPEFCGPLSHMGNAFAATAEIGRALDCFDAVLERNPNDEVAKRAWFSKGYILHRNHEYQEAKECYDQALAIDPAYQLCLQSKEELLQEQEELSSNESLDGDADSEILERPNLEDAHTSLAGDYSEGLE